MIQLITIPLYLQRFVKNLKRIDADTIISLKSISNELLMSRSQVSRNLHRLKKMGIETGIRFTHILRIDKEKFNAFKIRQTSWSEGSEKSYPLHTISTPISSEKSYPLHMDLSKTFLHATGRIKTYHTTEECGQNEYPLHAVENKISPLNNPHKGNILIKNKPPIIPQKWGMVSKNLTLPIDLNPSEYGTLISKQDESNHSKYNRKIRKEKLISQQEEKSKYVLSVLNKARKRVNRHARDISATTDSLYHIADRLASGSSVEDCVAVINVCVRECKKNKDSFIYFNSVSPFRADNFARKLGTSEEGDEVLADDTIQVVDQTYARREVTALDYEAGKLCIDELKKKLNVY